MPTDFFLRKDFQDGFRSLTNPVSNVGHPCVFFDRTQPTRTWPFFWSDSTIHCNQLLDLLRNCESIYILTKAFICCSWATGNRPHALLKSLCVVDRSTAVPLPREFDFFHLLLPFLAVLSKCIARTEVHHYVYLYPEKTWKAGCDKHVPSCPTGFGRVLCTLS